MVTLKGGVLVSQEALELAIGLELRGISIKADAGTLKAFPASAITPADVAAITRLKWHLLVIAAYTAPLDGNP